MRERCPTDVEEDTHEVSPSVLALSGPDLGSVTSIGLRTVKTRNQDYLHFGLRMAQYAVFAINVNVSPQQNSV